MVPNKFVKINNRIKSEDPMPSDIKLFDSFSVDDLIELIEFMKNGVITEKMSILFILTYDEGKYFDIEEKLGFKTINIFLYDCFKEIIKSKSFDYIMSSEILNKVYASNLLSRILNVAKEDEKEGFFVKDFIIMGYDFLSLKIEENSFIGCFIPRFKGVNDNAAKNLVHKNDFNILMLMERVKIISEIIFIFRARKEPKNFNMSDDELEKYIKKALERVRPVIMEGWVDEMLPDEILSVVNNKKDDTGIMGELLAGSEDLGNGLIKDADGIIRKPIEYRDLILDAEADSVGISWTPILAILAIGLAIWASVFVPSSFTKKDDETFLEE